MNSVASLCSFNADRKECVLSKVELLSFENHSDLKVGFSIEDRFSDIGATVKVLADELSKLVLDLPVFFTKNPETGQFELNALMGFAPDENLFFRDGEWKASYVPLDIRRRPFQALLFTEKTLGADENGNPQVKVGIDVQSKRLADDGEALFNKDGTNTHYLNDVSGVLGAIVSGSQLTGVFIQTLADKGLITKAQLSVQSQDNRTISFEGLYCIDEEKLASLSQEDILNFHKMGYLQACYAMIHSLGHMEKLFEWKRQVIDK